MAEEFKKDVMVASIKDTEADLHEARRHYKHGRFKEGREKLISAFENLDRILKRNI